MPASLDEVLVTEDWARRPSRPPDVVAESAALSLLARALADRPETFLRTLTDTALEFTQAESAGISILEAESGEETFRWRATSGRWRPFEGGSIRRDESPSGVVIDRNQPMLFQEPARCFTSLALEPPAISALLIPFSVEGIVVGTIWIVAHTPGRRFDAEDARLLASLGRFASAGYQFLRAREARQESDARAAILARIDDATRPLTDPAAIALAAIRILGNHLAVERAAYLEVDGREEVATVVGSYSPAALPLLGEFRITEFGRKAVEELRSDHPLVESDVHRSQRTAEGKARLDGMAVRSFLAVPLRKGGRLSAMVAVGDSRPRDWVADEIDTVRLVASRCWESIERSRVTRILAESEARFRAVVSQATIGVALADMTGSLRFVNERFREITDRTEAELLASGIEDLTHPEDRARVAERLERLVAGGGPFALEHRCLRKDGTVAWLHSGAALIHGADGTAEEIVVTAIDITARKQADEALREADRRKDEFLVTLAHELRNPLAPIVNALHILRLTGGGESLIDGIRDTIERQVNQMVRLVDDLLEISLITRGKLDLRPVPIDLAAILHEAIETSQPLIQAANHLLTVSLPGKELIVLGDPGRLTQIFANLLNNAAKYTRPGGRIRLAAEADDLTARISIRDNGIGIPAEMLDRIFEMFTQVGTRDRGATGGLGIGLTLVRNLVELHGGAIEARSDGLGEGSEFIVHLPMAPDPLLGRSPRLDPVRHG